MVRINKETIKSKYISNINDYLNSKFTKSNNLFNLNDTELNDLDYVIGSDLIKDIFYWKNFDKIIFIKSRKSIRLKRFLKKKRGGENFFNIINF